MNPKLHNWLNTPKGKKVRAKISAAEARKQREKEANEVLRARGLNGVIKNG